jgi:lipopolysaccharide transport system permease protein
MINHLRELWHYRELLWSWTGREIKVRYKQSLLGAAWAIVQPLGTALIFTVVFARFIRVPTDGIPYPIFSYAALLPWTFFATSVSLATDSLVRNMNLVTKIYFPREILPIASVLAGLLDFAIAAIVFVGMAIYYHVAFSWSVVLVPILLIIQIILTLGVVLLASALNVFYRDVRFIIPLGLQLWMYLTPIIYPLSLVPERYRTIYLLNPMAGLIESYRRIIVQGEMPVLAQIAPAALVSFLLFLLAYAYFKQAEQVFADII